jgi:membrane dipeptidase
MMTIESAFRVLSYMRSWVGERSVEYALAGTALELQQNQQRGMLSVLFDIEGLKAIGDQIDLIDTFYAMGSPHLQQEQSVWRGLPGRR